MIASDFLKHYRGRCPFGSSPQHLATATARAVRAATLLKRASAAINTMEG